MSFRVERSGIEEAFELRIEMSLSNNKHSGDTQEISPLRFTLVERTIAILKNVSLSFRVKRSEAKESFELRSNMPFLEIKFTCDTHEISLLRFTP